jgi:hypothetical protein
MKCKKCGSDAINKVSSGNMHGFKFVCAECDAFIQWAGKIELSDVSACGQIAYLEKEYKRKEGIFNNTGNKDNPKALVELKMIKSIIESIKKVA